MAKTKGAVSPKFKKIFYIGAKFGDWELIDNNLTYSGSQNHGKVKVKCKCGTEQLSDPYPLKKGTSTCCFKCGHNKIGKNHHSFTGYKEIPGSWFSRYSKTKKREFTITIEQIYEMWIKQDKKCKLSGLDISFENFNNKKTRHRYDLICTASLDRIDSKKGYILDNIQLVHKDINMMKKEYDQKYFIGLCKLVTDHINSYK
jgi:hypothetical protein